MKKLIMSSLLLCSMMFFVAGSAFAVKPGADGDLPVIKPNGFPAGEHFNLNIHGKKIDFSCPDPYSGPDYNAHHSGIRLIYQSRLVALLQMQNLQQKT